MHKLINNVINMGFLNLILWFVFVLIIWWFFNKGFFIQETFLEIEHKVYWYDIQTIFLMMALFIYGIYSWKN